MDGTPVAKAEATQDGATEPGATAAGPVIVADAGPRSRWSKAPTMAVAALVVGWCLLLLVQADAGQRTRWATVFIALVVQAMPFLALGVCVSAALAAFVTPAALRRLVPDRPVIGVPVACTAATLLPGCECSSVPVAARLLGQGVSESAALAFLLAAPAVNPVVIAATLVAFPGHPEMALARFLASWITAMAVGLLWRRIGVPIRLPKRYVSTPDGAGSGARLSRLAEVIVEDFAYAAGYLTVGAGLGATLQALLPRTVADAAAALGPVAVLALALVAVAIAVCSEADAFLAASFRQFSRTAQLAFMVVGPMVDVKLIALQAGTFGRRFAARFAPATFVIAVLAATGVGAVLL
ncbi:permease [Solihabitans fulvus]|uniref:permease n=1 Tax=Solihabitans fulvus TaxID=1892852 RepID=UPI001661B2D7|nr:permease [Solihabitans fulvus]